MKAAYVELVECAGDRAVEIIVEGMEDELSFQNRMFAAKSFLASEYGRKRGFGHAASATATLELGNTGGGRQVLVLRWKDEPAVFPSDAPLIDVTPEA